MTALEWQYPPRARGEIEIAIEGKGSSRSIGVLASFLTPGGKGRIAYRMAVCVPVVG
ncbi:protein of unknown function [Candidatus Methylocalor cossyra]|uniref:Uncharacterized protein n=1 Tax=Candidatus Methylocalor cossyra TaxID=3108543 RepID=A0ABP1C777_9GAMM